jgi:hypothetical protein
MPDQTALALTEIGKPLIKIRLPIPYDYELKEQEVLVKVTATGRTFHSIRGGSRNLTVMQLHP